MANSKTRNDETVLQGIANSPDLPESEKTGERLHQEARILVGAGSETTGSTLDVIIFQVLSNHHVAQKLQEELVQASSKGMDMTTGSSLRSLPYLTAVVNEGLRLGNAVSGRLPRVDPRKPHIYKTYILPAGTEISMSLRPMATDPAVYDEPLLFNPDRWLTTSDTAKRELMERNFVPFGRGSRSCIGRELALLMLYMMTASFFTRFDAELFETDESDLTMAYDFFAPWPKKDSVGVQVKLR